MAKKQSTEGKTLEELERAMDEMNRQKLQDVMQRIDDCEERLGELKEQKLHLESVLAKRNAL